MQPRWGTEEPGAHSHAVTQNSALAPFRSVLDTATRGQNMFSYYVLYFLEMTGRLCERPNVTG